MKVYIFSVSDLCSGGPEALHQLAYYCNQCGLDAYTVYYQPATYHYIDAQPIERYIQYGVKTVRLQDTEDKKDNICIAPENAPWCLNNIHHAKKVVWWLGVAANHFEYPTLKQWIVYKKRYYLHQSVKHLHKVLYNDRNVLHVCGSKFAYEYVKNKYPSNTHVEYLVEPISLDFLKCRFKEETRKDVVLYNPAKGSERMNRLLKRSRFNYVPLRNYTPAQLACLYNTSKLYVDFGEFGGPERIPKEAVYFGCNILVDNHNAAKNDFDVAIPTRYKLDDTLSDGEVENMIDYMLANYSDINKDFLPFREKISNLEKNFMAQIKKLF